MSKPRAFSLALTGSVFAALLAVGPVSAAGLVVTVLDREGVPVPGVAVYLQSPELQPGEAPVETSAVMDQRDTRFVPHVLVVQTGTSVKFPNSDVIAHHVYSFSHPNHFKLPIYRGEAYSPITFSESGLVVLGCNIHDNMLGYILVVDTPVFAMTDTAGQVTLDVGRIDTGELGVWSPRIRDDVDKLTVTVDASDVPGSIALHLAKSLRPPHDEESGALTWSDY